MERFEEELDEREGGKVKTLVLGSGASALAYLFYNPDSFALAGEQVGGLFAQAQNLGPQYIWKTASTTRLLKDMGYFDEGSEMTKVTVQMVRIGYLWKGKITRLQDLEIDDRRDIQRLYALKTRGIAPKASFMSDGKSEFEIYSLPVDALIAELLRRVSLRLVLQKASEIDMYNKVVRIENNGPKALPTFIPYDKLVSTIPAPVLLKLIGNESEVTRLRAFDKVYEKTAAYYPFEHVLCSGGEFDYVYVAGDEYPFHRVRKLDDRLVVREFTLIDGYSGPKFPESVLTQKKGQIVSGHEVLESLPPDSVECYGRYAEWKHGIRLEDVLEEIQ